MHAWLAQQSVAGSVSVGLARPGNYRGVYLADDNQLQVSLQLSVGGNAPRRSPGRKAICAITQPTHLIPWCRDCSSPTVRWVATPLADLSVCVQGATEESLRVGRWHEAGKAHAHSGLSLRLARSPSFIVLSAVPKPRSGAPLPTATIAPPSGEAATASLPPASRTSYFTACALSGATRRAVSTSLVC
jgi:hypothetical protein